MISGIGAGTIASALDPWQLRIQGLSLADVPAQEPSGS
jgi:hypothetical protein